MEGCKKKSEQAAQALKITAYDLKDLGIIDQILPEPPGCAHSDPLATAEILKQAILENLEYLSQLPTDKLKELRYQKFRNIGVFIE